MEKKIKVKVMRYNPKKDKEPRYQLYEVSYNEDMIVLTLLRKIYEELDGTLAFQNYRCGRGICDTCKVKINGKVIKSCETPLPYLEEVILEPANPDKVIKDLIVQM